jgi:dTDP-4-dehydrorhamnose reductase
VGSDSNFMDSQRLLIIGARGFLGSYAVRSATGQFQIIQGDRSANGEPGTVQVDVADGSSLERAFNQVQPDFVLLLAAMSDIDRCEALPERAFAINAKGAENVANACVRAKARLLFASSAAVFDGKKHGYNERDSISPLSVYGKTKAWAENAVSSLLPTAIILRFALVLGLAGKSGTNAMLDGIFQKWKTGEPVYFPANESRNPIDAASLSALMVGMLSTSGLSGVYHVGSSDSISRHELGKRLAARSGVPESLVRRQDSPSPGRAPRGDDHFLLTDKIQKDCNVEAVTTDQVIERCLS